MFTFCRHLAHYMCNFAPKVSVQRNGKRKYVLQHTFLLKKSSLSVGILQNKMLNLQSDSQPVPVAQVFRKEFRMKTSPRKRHLAESSQFRNRQNSKLQMDSRGRMPTIYILPQQVISGWIHTSHRI